MTLVEVTYALQTPLKEEQLRSLGAHANTYGLRRVRLDPSGQALTVEFDASRLKEAQVSHVLRSAKIPIAGAVEPAGK